MRKLVTTANWETNTVSEHEASAFNPNFGSCCDVAHFRVHLGGTTCDTWNKSAINVFVEDFLKDHPEYPPQVESVVDMVRMKSRAALDSAIRRYRESLIRREDRELEELRRQKNSQERRRKVSSAALAYLTHKW